MAARKKPAPPTEFEVTVPASRFAWLVNSTLPFADDGRTLPILGALHFTTLDGYLYASATDRYTLGMARIKDAAESPVPDGLSATVARATAKQIVLWFKAPRGMDPTLRLVFTETTVRVSVVGGFGDIEDAAVTWQLVPGEYPTLGHVVTGAAEKFKAAGSPSPVSFNPGFLARFAHVIDGGEPLTMWAGDPIAAVSVRIGNDFFGVIMPTRHQNRSPEMTDLAWLSFFAARSKKEKVA